MKPHKFKGNCQKLNFLVKQYPLQQNITKPRVPITQYLEHTIYNKKLLDMKKIGKCGSQSRENPSSNDKSTNDPETGVIR